MVIQNLIKKQLEKKKKKAADKKKNKAKASKSKSTVNKAKKQKKPKRASRQSSSSSSSSESDSGRQKLKAVQSKLYDDAAAIDKKFRMTGALVKKPENPENFAREILKAEWREMTIDSKVTGDQMKTLDGYLKNRAELKSMDHVVIAEKVDDDDRKATTRLKILTKYDEGRFAAIYMVQNEAAVNNDVVLVGNGRYMMKTALRLLSSHQITYRLSREINTLKSLWNKPNDAPQRIPPVLHEGRILGVPFYVTQIYDVNLEKCREEMGGGTFSVRSVFHVGQEILTAIKFLHRRQIIHRDIKPTNIVLNLTNRDQWYLIDFGDAVASGRTSALSPPDGHTLSFLSREAHEVLTSVTASTTLQDLDSWWLVMVDMFKALPWRATTKIDAVVEHKKDFFQNVPSNLPIQLQEIAKLLKNDTPPYKEITKLVTDGIGTSKESGYVPEWYDRAATKIRKAKKKTSGTEETTTTTTLENEEPVMATPPVPTPDRRDASVYLSATMDAPAAPRLTRKPSREEIERPMNPMLAETPFQPVKPQDRSAYFSDFPVAAASANVGDNKRKYRYKPKNK